MLFPIHEVSIYLSRYRYRNIPTRRRAGIVFRISKSNHYKFPKNPYYRCMIEWNDLTVDMSLIDDKRAFSRNIKDLVQNPYVKVL